MIRVGKLPGGTLLGEQDGTLYKGTTKQVMFKDLDFELQGGIGIYRYNGEIIAKGTVGAPDQEGERSLRLVTVVDWVAA